MDAAHLDRIVREVLTRLAPRLGANGARGQLVVVLTGATVGAGAAMAELQALIFKGFYLRIACSEMAEHLSGARLNAALKGLPQWEILPAGSWFQALADARGVAVPLLSVDALSRLAALLADTETANLLLHALFAGKPLILARDGVDDPAGRAELGFGHANPALLRAVAERLRAVESFGATVTRVAGLADRVAALIPAAGEISAAAHRAGFATAKPVISGGDVMEAARRGGDLECAATALVTPLALETAQRHGVRIVRNRPDGAEQGARARW